jgi:iron complex transport system substrate-binding protein
LRSLLVRYSFVLLVGLLFCPIPLSFSGLALSAEPLVIQDDLNRSIQFVKVPTRVVSLAPSITEMLFALGLDREIIAVTQFCNYPPEALAKQKVGYSNPSIEAIIALDPDLIIAPREFLRADLLGKVEQLQIPLVVLSANSLPDITTHLTKLGTIFGRAVQAESAIAHLHQHIDAIRRVTAGLPDVRVLYVLNSHPLITVGPGSFIHELIGLAGAINIAGHTATPYPRFNMEVVLREDPDVLIFPVGKVESVPLSEQQVWQQWPALSAVKHGRLRHVPSDLLNRPGPRIAEGLEALARAIHPEAFTEVSTPSR